MSHLLRALLLATLVTVVACPDPEPLEPTSSDAPAPREFTARTARDSYEIRVVPVPAPVPLNELFELTVEITPGKGAAAIDSVLVDADMPEHKHGMNTKPEVSGDGRVWRVEGMLFHMPGYWELYVDVESGGLVERAVIPVELEMP